MPIYTFFLVKVEEQNSRIALALYHSGKGSEREKIQFMHLTDNFKK
jgi:hypothetical protein